MENNINLSKSKYCAVWQCPKIAWLRKYHPEAQEIGADVVARMAAGNEVGALARNLFGAYTDVTSFDGEHLDLRQMIENTRVEMTNETAVICEAAFSFDGLYCAVDILKRERGGWAIYEVKSSTQDDKAVYAADVAYQKYVLEHCGVRVTGTYLVTLNNQYVFDGTLDLAELFRVTDIASAVRSEEGLIEANIALAARYLDDPEEPPIDLSERCRDPYPCAFWGWCAKNLPQPSVFDLYRMNFSKKIEYYRKGIVSYADLSREAGIKNEKQLRQIAHALSEQGDEIDRGSIRAFLAKLSYPLYFLDFETVQPVIPRYIGTKPYAQIPFQYSLHIIEREGGALQHREFLAEPGTDPRRALAEQLCAAVPMGACVTAYNKAFECTRLKELAETFPDLAAHLLNIRDNIVDLLVPFQSGWYYNRAMGGSFSIKSVLPALFPDDPALDYHNLDEIHNGGEAMTAWPSMEHMSPEDRARTRQNLLEYCKLDTFAMVKVWEKLCEAAANESRS
ncbi:MAG: DUF2779 domain-containing protein [Oscillospiraceae bacterium]|nr:DUF2779 domain-containing protein [Oscillospiraceae bacterium]